MDSIPWEGTPGPRSGKIQKSTDGGSGPLGGAADFCPGIRSGVPRAMARVKGSKQTRFKADGP